MTPIRIRVFNVASYQNMTRVSVAIDTSKTESTVAYCDFVNRDPRAFVNLVVDESELAIWLEQHGGKPRLREILESKLEA